MNAAVAAVMRGLLLLLCVGLTACSLPRGAATQNELTDAETAATANVTVVPVTRDKLPDIRVWSRGVGSINNWPARSGAHRRGIAPHDTVDIIVWDNDTNSLLSTVGQKSVNLEKVHVNPDGQVFLPYVGAVRLGGLSANAARLKVQEAFEAIVPAAQVQLKWNFGSRNSVDLVSGFRNPGTYPLGFDTLTILDAFSIGGGVETSMRNPRVRLQRGSKSYAISLNHLYEAPNHNIHLHGNDKIIIEEDRRSFVALGAQGTEQLVHFEKDRITALEAVSIAGGLAPDRADAEGVLVLRTYPKFATARKGYEPEHARVVFVFDLTSADGLFSAKEFQVLSGDVVLASESPLVKWNTPIQFLNRLLNAARNVQRTF